MGCRHRAPAAPEPLGGGGGEPFGGGGPVGVGGAVGGSSPRPRSQVATRRRQPVARSHQASSAPKPASSARFLGGARLSAHIRSPQPCSACARCRAAVRGCPGLYASLGSGHAGGGPQLLRAAAWEARCFRPRPTLLCSRRK